MNIDQALARIEGMVKAAQTEHHVIELTEDDGWALQHPTRCLPRLLECSLHKLLNADSDAVWDALGDRPYGRYWVDVDDEGEVVPLPDSTPMPDETAATKLKAASPALALLVVQLGKALVDSPCNDEHDWRECPRESCQSICSRCCAINAIDAFAETLGEEGEG